MNTRENKERNLKRFEPWVLVGVTENEFKRATIESFIDEVRERGWMDPHMERAEKLANYFEMDLVSLRITEIREKFLKVRQDIYHEILSGQSSKDCSYYDVDRLIERFWDASNFKESATWMKIIDAINNRISKPTIHDTTLQTTSIKDKGAKEECCLCLQDIDVNSSAQKCSGCQECFHTHCVLKYLKSKHSCLVCVQNMFHNPTAFKKLPYEM